MALWDGLLHASWSCLRWETNFHRTAISLYLTQHVIIVMIQCNGGFAEPLRRTPDTPPPKKPIIRK